MSSASAVARRMRKKEEAEKTRKKVRLEPQELEVKTEKGLNEDEKMKPNVAKAIGKATKERRGEMLRRRNQRKKVTRPIAVKKEIKAEAPVKEEKGEESDVKPTVETKETLIKIKAEKVEKRCCEGGYEVHTDEETCSDVSGSRCVQYLNLLQFVVVVVNFRHACARFWVWQDPNPPLKFFDGFPSSEYEDLKARIAKVLGR